MGLLKTAVIGAAVYGAVKYLTKKDEITGRSKADEMMEKTPEWIEKAKTMGKDFTNKLDRQF